MVVRLPRLSNAAPITMPGVNGPSSGNASHYLTGYWNALCDAIEGALNTLQTQQTAITAAQTSADGAMSSAGAAQDTANTALYQVNGVIPVANGGTGDTSFTAHGVVLGEGTSPLGVTAAGAANTFLAGNTGADPAFREPVLASADFVNQGTIHTVLHGNAAGNPAWLAVDLSADVTGNLPVTNLNSGTSASSSTFWRGDGTWAAAGAGSVTSVGLSAPSIFTVSGSPVTGSGTLTFTLNNESANLVFAGPTSGGAATPTFRALVAADLPGGTTPVGANPTGTVGLSTVNGAAATFLRSDGAPPLSQAIVPTWSGYHNFSAGAEITPASPPLANEVGYLAAPINEQDGDYTFVLTDAGKTVRANISGAHTYTIPTHASVAFPTGTVIVIRNAAGSTANLTLTPAGGVNLYQAGATYSSTIILGPGSLVTIVQETSDNWVMTGTTVGGYTKPLLASFTYTHQPTSATATDITGGLQLFSPSLASAFSLNVLQQNVPARPYTIWTRASFSGNLNKAYSTYGIALADGSGKFITFSFWAGGAAGGAGPGGAFNYDTYSSSTARAGDTGVGDTFVAPPLIGVNDDGTSLHFLISYDGVSAYTLDTVSRTAYLSAPTTIGPFTMGYSQAITAVFAHWGPNLPGPL